MFPNTGGGPLLLCTASMSLNRFVDESCYSSWDSSYRRTWGRRTPGSRTSGQRTISTPSHSSSVTMALISSTACETRYPGVDLEDDSRREINALHAIFRPHSPSALPSTSRGHTPSHRAAGSIPRAARRATHTHSLIRSFEPRAPVEIARDPYRWLPRDPSSSACP